MDEKAKPDNIKRPDDKNFNVDIKARVKNISELDDDDIMWSLCGAE